MKRTLWTQEQLDSLRANYGKVPTRQLAAQLGHPLSSTYQMAARLGLAEKMQCATDQQIIDILRELNAQGYTDTEVATELANRLGMGVDRHRVSKIRRSLGLTFNKTSDRFRNRVRENTRRQLSAAGLDNIGQLRVQQWNKWKRQLGWPEHLTVRAVQSLEMFYRHGPLTRVQLCQLLGVSPKKRTAPCSNVRGGTVLAELQRAGLISRVRKAIKIPFDTPTNSQTWGNRTRTSDRRIRFKHLDVYMLNPGVQPNGRQTTELTSAS